ncbi:transposase, partial [Tepidimonas charontis]|uniref:transposase n=1 Tax=Tepidimonas charontis TaxID=2267262 RepID=UPI001F35AA63
RLVHRGKIKRLTHEERRLLKRRQAIEPVIGHLKQDHRMDRCHLKGEQGDRLHAVLCAAGYNIRWLLRMIANKGVPFLRRAFLRLIAAVRLLGHLLLPQRPTGIGGANPALPRLRLACK